MTRSLLLLLAAPALLGAGCWSLPDRYDPDRCSPRCGAGQRCDEGTCVAWSDGGQADVSAADGPRVDRSSDAPAGSDADADAGAGLPFTLIKKGTFWMGAPATDPCNPAWSTVDETRHRVTLTHGFELSTTEVTQAQFQQLMGYNNAWFSPGGEYERDCPDCPVEHVSWHEAAAFCNALSAWKGLEACYDCSGAQVMARCQTAAKYGGKAFYDCPGFRLPTEAEWEYAYRAGTTTPLHDGNSIALCEGNDPAANAIGWFKHNSGGIPHGTGTKPANPWGLYNMAGNVSEWCQDTFVRDLGPAAVVDPISTVESADRVRRGGYYYAEAELLRASARLLGEATRRVMYVGFRCARSR